MMRENGHTVETDLDRQPSTAHTNVPAQIITDLAAVLQTPEGKRVLLWVLGQCGVYRTGFQGDDAQTNRRLGEINIGLRLIAKLAEVGPSEYPRLLLWDAQRAEREKAEVYVADAK